jgi:hypothetical protein
MSCDQALSVIFGLQNLRGTVLDRGGHILLVGGAHPRTMALKSCINQGNLVHTMVDIDFSGGWGGDYKHYTPPGISADAKFLRSAPPCMTYLKKCVPGLGIKSNLVLIFPVSF